MREAVAAERLTVRLGGRPVLDALTFSIPAGQVTGVLGPSGCGKTTLLRTLVGVQRITSGQVRVLGEAAGDPRLRRRIGYATQGHAVYQDLTLRENLRYFGAASGLSRASTAAAMDEVIGDVDLGGLEDRLVGTFSGGQLARVDLAVALLAKPELLVLDEPTVGLDPVLRASLWSLFHRLTQTGSTLLVSSHVMDEAERCDELLFLRDGRLLAQDTPEALLAGTGARNLEAAFIDLAGRVTTTQKARP